MSDKDIRKIKAGDILRMSKGDFEVIVSFFDEDIQEQTIIIDDKGKAKVCANGDIIEVLHKIKTEHKHNADRGKDKEHTP